MKYDTDTILELYRGEAEKHQDSGTSTIQDIRTRKLEIDAIFSYLRNGMKVLEIGCGNGFVAQELVKQFDVKLDAFDFTPELINIAIKRKSTNTLGQVNFFHNDVLAYVKPNYYDLIFSERVLQNLTNWENQKKALQNIFNNLLPGGQYVMEECFWSGLNNLNAARKEVGLEEVKESWHNLYFHDEKVIDFMRELGAIFVEENCFLSGYYFGSRVLLPALMPKGKPVSSNSILNDYFSTLPPGGNFSPMKIMVFKKT